MKRKINRDSYLVVYTVYKMRPATLKHFGTVIWDPIFSVSWRWLAILITKILPRCEMHVDSDVFPRAEHVDDARWKTTKEGKLIRTNE